jgi:hypothetical protein
VGATNTINVSMQSESLSEVVVQTNFIFSKDCCYLSVSTVSADEIARQLQH